MLQLSKLNSIKELKKRKTMENDFGPYRSLMNFDLLLPDGDDDDDGTNLAEQREEIPHGFEADIDATYLPYQTASIVKVLNIIVAALLLFTVNDKNLLLVLNVSSLCVR